MAFTSSIFLFVFLKMKILFYIMKKIYLYVMII